MFKRLFSSFLPPQNRLLARRLLAEHIQPYWAHFLLALLFMVLSSLSTAALPYLLQPVFDEVFSHGTPHLLGWFCAAVFLSFFVKGLSSYGETLVMTYIGQKIICDLQNRLFRHLMTLNLSFFHSMPTGSLLSRFSYDINLMRATVASTLVGIGKDTLTLIFLITLMFVRDWFLASMAFFVFPAAVIPIIRLGRRIRKVTDRTQDELAQLTTHLSQAFHGIRMVKAYGQVPYEIKRVEEKTRRIFRLVYQSIRVKSASHPIIETLAGVAITGVIGYGGWQVMMASRTTGEFISFIGALILAYEPLKRLSNLNATLQEGLAAGQRIFEILDIQPAIQDHPQAQPLAGFHHQLSFHTVSFSYPNGKKALQEISLTLKKGESIALVGPSGSGKSTFINLIPRFYECCDGQILLDGTDYRLYTLESLRQHIALVSQEIHLFDETIWDNIAYGRTDASPEEVMQAAQAAAAHEFILKLPQGYQTLIGENGVKLSGGQRQRIAIARAMLKNAPLLLLDEATSALDTHSERQVQSALKALMKGRTTIMVAHRLSTIIEADHIYVLEEGRIVESGNHQSLLQQKGIYAHLWQSQSQQSIAS